MPLCWEVRLLQYCGILLHKHQTIRIFWTKTVWCSRTPAMVVQLLTQVALTLLEAYKYTYC